MPKKSKKKSSSRIIQILFSISLLAIIIFYIVDIWVSLFVVQVLKTIFYLILGMTIFAGVLSLFSGGDDDVEGGILP